MAGKLGELASARPPQRIHLEEPFLRMQEAKGSRQIRQVAGGDGWHARFVSRDLDRKVEPGERLLPLQDCGAAGKNMPEPKPCKDHKQNRRAENACKDSPYKPLLHRSLSGKDDVDAGHWERMVG